MKEKYIKQAEWEKARVRRYQLKLNLNTDKEIIEQLEKQDSMQGYIKRLIREDIERSNGARSF